MTGLFLVLPHTCNNSNIILINLLIIYKFVFLNYNQFIDHRIA